MEVEKVANGGSSQCNCAIITYHEVCHPIHVFRVMELIRNGKVIWSYRVG